MEASKNKELIQELRDERVTGFNLTVVACKAADALEAADARISMLEFSVSETARIKDAEITLLRTRVEVAEKMAEALNDLRCKFERTREFGCLPIELVKASAALKAWEELK